LPLGRLGHGEIPVDRRATDLDLPRHGSHAQALGVQPPDLVVAVDPAGMAHPAQCRKGSWWR